MALGDGVIRASCGGCGKIYKVPPDKAGKRARCKQCGQMFTVPDPNGGLGVSPGADLAALASAEAAAPSGAQAANQCPSCNAPAAGDAMFCISCGYNFKTGQVTTTQRELASPAVAPGMGHRAQTQADGGGKSKAILGGVGTVAAIAVFILIKVFAAMSGSANVDGLIDEQVAIFQDVVEAMEMVRDDRSAEQAAEKLQGLAVRSKAWMDKANKTKASKSKMKKVEARLRRELEPLRGRIEVAMGRMVANPQWANTIRKPLIDVFKAMATGSEGQQIVRGLNATFDEIARMAPKPQPKPRPTRRPPVAARQPASVSAPNLLDARKGFKTKARGGRSHPTLPKPPEGVLRVVQYPGPLGRMNAYLSPPPDAAPGKKHPAIIWIFGGFSNGIGETAWVKASWANDQSASVFREHGVVTMYPSLRGANGNPGQIENFYGEVDDVLAALDYLSKVPYVDPNRIYLGGHSTGGTLALLVAASTDRFRAVLSFGPVEDPAGYGKENLVYDPRDNDERRLRSPLAFLGAIKSPTWVIEGNDGNIGSLNALKAAAKNPRLTFVGVPGADHFNVLGPANYEIARQIPSDTRSRASLRVSGAQISAAVRRPRPTGGARPGGPKPSRPEPSIPPSVVSAVRKALVQQWSLHRSGKGAELKEHLVPEAQTGVSDATIAAAKAEGKEAAPVHRATRFEDLSDGKANRLAVLDRSGKRLAVVRLDNGRWLSETRWFPVAEPPDPTVALKALVDKAVSESTFHANDERGSLMVKRLLPTEADLKAALGDDGTRAWDKIAPTVDYAIRSPSMILGPLKRKKRSDAIPIVDVRANAAPALAAAAQKVPAGIPIRLVALRDRDNQVHEWGPFLYVNDRWVLMEDLRYLDLLVGGADPGDAVKAMAGIKKELLALGAVVNRHRVRSRGPYPRALSVIAGDVKDPGLLVDPWGTPYVLVTPGTERKIGSAGAKTPLLATSFPPDGKSYVVMYHSGLARTVPRDDFTAQVAASQGTMPPIPGFMMDDVDRLIRVYQGAGAFNREPIIEKLGKTGSPRAAAVLAPALKDLGSRDEVAAALVMIGRPAADAVANALDPDQSFATQEALKILERIGTRKQIPKVKALANTKWAFSYKREMEAALKAMSRR